MRTPQYGTCILLLLTLPLLAQRPKVPETETHFRIWAIDKVVVVDGARQPAHAAGMKAFVAIYNRNSTLCFVEYVAAKHSDLDALRQSTDPQVVWFDKHKTNPTVLLNAARVAGFSQLDLEKFYVRVK